MKIDKEETHSKNNPASKKTDIFMAVPPELAIYISTFLAPNDLLNARIVSREWNKRVDDPNLWKDRLVALEIKPQSYREQFFSVNSDLQECVNKILEAIIQFNKELRNIDADSNGKVVSPPTSEDDIEDWAAVDESFDASLESSKMRDSATVKQGEIEFPGSFTISCNSDNLTENIFTTTENLIGSSDEPLGPVDLGNFPNFNQDLFSIIVHEIEISNSFGPSYLFVNCIIGILEQHLIARDARVSTYILFTNVLKKLKINQLQTLQENALTIVLYYLFFASSMPYLNFQAGHSGKIYKMTEKDYRDIMLLTKSIIELEVIDINKIRGSAEATKQSVLPYLIRRGFHTSKRPPPSMVNMLIQAGANFNFTIFSTPEEITFLDSLLLHEIFFFMSHSCLQQLMNPQLEAYLQEYGKFIGKENLVGSKQSPLSMEFLQMAKNIFSKGGQFSTYAVLAKKCHSVLLSIQITYYSDIGDIEDETGLFKELLLAALKQLEQLQQDSKYNFKFGKI